MTTPPHEDADARAVADAVAARHRWHQARLDRLDEQAVSELATFVVAAWLGDGARVLDDAAATWDVDWQHDARLVQLRVVCCAAAEDEDASAAFVWELGDPAPTGADAVVLARHDGDTLESGWRFWVLPADAVDGRHQVTARQLAVHGAEPVAGADLDAAVLDAAAGPPIS